MTAWTPPNTISLSSNDVRIVVNGLTNPETRDAALAFVDTLTDPGYAYVIACELAYRRYEPRFPIGTMADYRSHIRHLAAN
jgi:hypothetical protein